MSLIGSTVYGIPKYEAIGTAIMKWLKIKEEDLAVILIVLLTLIIAELALL